MNLCFPVLHILLTYVYCRVCFTFPVDHYHVMEMCDCLMTSSPWQQPQSGSSGHCCPSWLQERAASVSFNLSGSSIHKLSTRLACTATVSWPELSIPQDPPRERNQHRVMSVASTVDISVSQTYLPMPGRQLVYCMEGDAHLWQLEHS